ncbi:MAG TPA: 2-amino-4-hydroxy-6-hydroxymethyldihydropteridine diphosphokinase [bacterium]|nr:2-amino-4-hydroxy-6-hydroxymethyldihydropteridine diphosphokinase [bacterium]
MARVYMSLGSNLGDRKATLESALRHLKASRHVSVLRASSIYETEPIGYADQPWFYNLAAEVETELDPDELLALTKQVERDLNRTRQIRWGPRTIDIDILLYDDIVVNGDRLTLPHPEMTQRRFVLEPLHEIAPELKLPDGRRIADLLPNVSAQEVRRVAV